MLTGALYFNKMPFIKTGLAICILLFGLLGLNWLIASAFFNNLSDAAPYNHVTLSVGAATGTLLLPAGLEKSFHVGFAFVLPAILWLLPLLRLREKEF